MYCMVHPEETRKLENNHLNDKNPPKLIIRQVGKFFSFYFPESEQVYEADQEVSFKILDCFKPSLTTYLFEPLDTFFEPYLCLLQTVITCSPDRSRYHEFHKRGGVKLYMPCWKLDELLAVGAYMVKCNPELEDFHSPEKIKEKFHQFGGIYRYVLPNHQDDYTSALSDQLSVLNESVPMDLFIPGKNIERTDNRKRLISHFILHYDVCYGETEGDAEFIHFEMRNASESVRKILEDRMKDLFASTEQLKSMFHGHTPQDWELFEFVVRKGIEKNLFSWEIFDRVEKKWVPYKFNIQDVEDVPKGELIAKNMKPGILYRSEDKQFPIAKFLFKNNCNEVNGVQVTFRERRPHPLGTYEKLFKTLGMDFEKEVIHLFLVPQPKHEKEYVKLNKSSFYHKNLDNVPSKNVKHSILRSNFE